MSKKLELVEMDGDVLIHSGPWRGEVVTGTRRRPDEVRDVRYTRLCFHWSLRAYTDIRRLTVRPHCFSPTVDWLIDW